MAFLVVQTGASKGSRTEITQDETTLGRSPENTLALDSPSVSGKHCSIIRKGRRYVLRDLGSTNGTYINGDAVDEVELKPKDVFMAGEIELMFDGEDVEVAEPEPTPEALTSPPTNVTRPMGHVGHAPVGEAQPFGARPNRRKAWLVILVLMGLLVLGGLGMFLYVVF